jgi:hypothetical protein
MSQGPAAIPLGRCAASLNWIEVPRPLATLNFLIYLITFVILGVSIYGIYIELLYTDKAEILFNL